MPKPDDVPGRLCALCDGPHDTEKCNTLECGICGSTDHKDDACPDRIQ